MNVMVLMSPGCGHGERAVALVRDVLRTHGVRATVEVVLVATPEEAQRLRFPGSPTVRVDGVDIDPKAPTNVGLG